MNLTPVEGILQSNVFERIRDKEISDNICFVKA